MITDANRYYGAVFNKIVDFMDIAASIERISAEYTGFYLVQGAVPIYIKYSTRRRGPWSFNFQRKHQEFQEELHLRYGECLTVFVCGKDGIAALKHELFRKVLDTTFEEQESVTIKRRHNEMYGIRGRDGTLERKVSRGSLEELFKTLVPTAVAA